MVIQANGNKLHLESIDRIGSIPLVESSFRRAENWYGKVKNNNRFFNWYFGTAEATIHAAYETMQPAVRLLETPLKRLDTVMCKSLDILEQRMPSAYLPPEMMYWNTKEYMTDHLVRPVLKRADSMKQLGTAVLENPLTTYAADRLDGAFTAGDLLVDKYLSPLPVDQDQTDAPVEDDNNEVIAVDEKGAIKAIHHGQRFSRKLKRRLTQRTLAEARALKKQSKEAIHIMIYVLELIATDPKLALEKAKELWAYLSGDEPENQARPVTLEQLIVLLTRESARRVVHFINYTATITAGLPRVMSHTSMEVVHYILQWLPIKNAVNDKNLSKDEAQSLVQRMLWFYTNLQGLTNNALENLADRFAGIEKLPETSSSTTSTSLNTIQRRRMDVHDNNAINESHNNINGVY